MRFVPTPKAAALVRDLAPETFFIGFKLEVAKSPAELVGIATDWARRTHADLVVANDMRDIEHGTHTGHLVRPDGTVEQVVQGKEMIARSLVTLLDRRLAQRPLRPQTAAPRGDGASR